MQQSSGFVHSHWTKNESFPSSLPTKTASLRPLIRDQPKGRVREREREKELRGWGAAPGPSFTLSALLAGDSVQDLLITTHWSSNPKDLIDSDCCSGFSALPSPPCSPHPSPATLINCWYAWQAKRGPVKQGYGEGSGELGVGALSVVYTATGSRRSGGGCLDTSRSPDVSVSHLPPHLSPLVSVKAMSQQYFT